MSAEENTVTIEDSFEELKSIIEKMNSDDCKLEESFKLYQRGVAICKDCNERIDKVEKEIEILGGSLNA